MRIFAIEFLELCAVLGGVKHSPIKFLLASLALATACGSDGPIVDSEPVSIIVGATDSLTSIDPAVSWEAYSWEFMRSVQQGLYRYEHGSIDLEATLADGEPEVSSDGLEWTVRLKPGLAFQDGTPVTAATVKYSIDRAAQLGTDVAVDFIVSIVDRVELDETDDLIVRFVLREKIGFFKALLATPPYYLVNSKAFPVDRKVTNPFGEHEAGVDIDQTKLDVEAISGLGPYLVESFGTNSENYTDIVLTKNPSFPGAAPLNDHLTLRRYTSTPELRSALENDEVDVAWRQLSTADYAELESNDEVDVKEIGGIVIRYIVVNSAEVQDENVRKALAAAIDRTPLADEVYGSRAAPLFSPVPVGLWGHLATFKDAYGENGNLAMARSYLEAAGYGEGSEEFPNPKYEMTLWHTGENHYGPEETNLATKIKEQWEATGMMNVTLASRPTWGEFKAERQTAQAFLYGWFPDYIDPDNYTRPFMGGSMSQMSGRDPVPQVVSLIEEAKAELVFSERERIYADVQREWADTVPTIPLTQQLNYISHRENVSLTLPSATMSLHYETITK